MSMLIRYNKKPTAAIYTATMPRKMRVRLLMPEWACSCPSAHFHALIRSLMRTCLLIQIRCAHTARLRLLAQRIAKASVGDDRIVLWRSFAQFRAQRLD